MGFLLGPALGGVLIGAIGPAATLVVEATAFTVAMVMILLVRVPFDPPQPPRHERAVAAIREGLATIWHNPVVRGYTLLTTSWNLCAAGAFALIVPLLREEIGLSSAEVGVILGVGRVDGPAGGVVAGWAGERFGPSRVVTRGVPLNGVVRRPARTEPGLRRRPRARTPPAACWTGR